MSDYQERISDLLECCQSEWVTLEQLVKDSKATPSVNYANKELRDGIKKLVQLQDNLDEIGNIVENNTEWNKKADILMEDVRNRLQFAAKLTMNVNMKPTNNQSLLPSPAIDTGLNALETRHSIETNKANSQAIYNTTNNTTNNTINNTVITASTIKEEDEDEEPFLDASEELPQAQTPRSLPYKNNPPSNDYMKSSSSSHSSSSSTNSSIKTNDNSTPTVFGRRSILADQDMISLQHHLLAPEKKPSKTTSSSLFPLLKKGLKSSHSTPVNGGAPAQINFFKNDTETKDAKHFIFATDATVDHPLRIGVGYGSYICYSCTVLSDKGAPITVRKRYSDFVDLREELVKQYPSLKKSIPKLPPKKVVGKFTPAFVEQRRGDLEYFFKYVVLHPTLGASGIVRHWIAP